MAYNPSNPNKYKNQASEYSASVSHVNSDLSVALSELNQVNEILGFSNNEAKGVSTGTNGCDDILTYNVLVGNEEIKSEIESIQNDLGMYTGLISSKATELDNEEKLEYERMMALKKAQEENGNDSITIE